MATRCFEKVMYQELYFFSAKEFVMTNEREKKSGDASVVWKLESLPIKAGTVSIKKYCLVSCASLSCRDAVKTSRRRCSGIYSRTERSKGEVFEW